MAARSGSLMLGVVVPAVGVMVAAPVASFATDVAFAEPSGAQTAKAPVAGPAANADTELSRPGDLISTQRGCVPVIISAPHGGTIRIPGSKDRLTGVTVRDVNTAEIAMLVAHRVAEKLGGKPYFVIAQFSRKDADPNRSRDEAVENEAAGVQYDAYHAALRRSVDECRAKFGSAILIDIHGQAKRPEAIIRGTRNGKTVQSLLKRHGDAGLVGPHSVFGGLKAKGYTIEPDPAAVTADVKPDKPADADAGTGKSGEPSHTDAPGVPTDGAKSIERADGANVGIGRETMFDGGFIVFNYGSQNDNGVDAIQIEIGGERSSATLKFSRDLGDAIAEYVNHYNKPGGVPGMPAEVRPAIPAGKRTAPNGSAPPTNAPAAPSAPITPSLPSTQPTPQGEPQPDAGKVPKSR